MSMIDEQGIGEDMPQAENSDATEWDTFLADLVQRSQRVTQRKQERSKRRDKDIQ
ncbi:MAG: hypothetical protein HKO62_06040, partial [Gammaproteobacteria bacterium]|nr:hypothetical protein [Gammaproteobacteria bacterium]